MPRKTVTRTRPFRFRADGFNEAAARCRGKPPPKEHDYPDATMASMRPRPDAAENHRQAEAEDAARKASMRPRPDAAENPARRTPSRPPQERFNEAAARCRGKPASACRPGAAGSLLQ